jgi:hypothetical protein
MSRAISSDNKGGSQKLRRRILSTAFLIVIANKPYARIAKPLAQPRQRVGLNRREKQRV